jgi:cation diffusion facilitator CzcD-associated flavoprotein CzcO
VIATAIDSVTPQGIVTTDGVLHAADAIILSTGFRPTDPPLAPYIVGRNESSLAEAWRGSPTAYMGTTIAGFPNLFMLLGPNTGLGHSSVVLMVEAQIDHILGVLQLLEQRGSNAAEPMLAAQQRFARMVDERLAATAWNSGGCKSWYLDRTGRNSALWPDGVGRFRRTVQHVIPADYRLAPPRGPATLETHV